MRDFSLSEVLAENYLTLGFTPMTVLEAVMDDLINNRFDAEWIAEMETTKEELVKALVDLVVDVAYDIDRVRF